MKQPKIKITDVYGNDQGCGNIMSMNWDEKGVLYVVKVDFIGSGNSNEFTSFYNKNGELVNINGTLKGELVPKF